MSNYFQFIPFGSSLPIENPHAVSVSFPLLQNVIDYEEGDQLAIAQMQSGYPRFFQNKLVQKLVDFIRDKYDISSSKVILPIASVKAKIILEELVERQFEFIEEDENVFLIIENDQDFIKKCSDIIRNIGLLISSRKAETTLFKLKQINTIFEEEKSKSHPENLIKKIISNAYNASSEATILLTNSGMNALFAAYKTILEIQKTAERKTVIQLGWLYVDTMEIVEKQSESCYVQINIHAQEQLESWLIENHTRVAVLITEVVTNPLLQCVDIPWISSLCKKYNIALIVDATLATPFNVDILPYCDIVVESLTKFACGTADLLMGGIIINEKSQIIQAHKNKIKRYAIPAFKGEIERLAHQIQQYEERVKKVSENTVLLLEYLNKQTYIKEVYSVLHSNSIENYNKISKSKYQIPGLISIVFNDDLKWFYDNLNVAKGPSLGTEFTLAMPYVYLAHYEDLKSFDGKQKLMSLGINPNLLRISIGTEAIDDIISSFENLKMVNQKC